MEDIKHLERCYAIEFYLDENAFEGTKLDITSYLVSYNETEDPIEKQRLYLLVTHYFPESAPNSQRFHTLAKIVKDAYIKKR